MMIVLNEKNYAEECLTKKELVKKPYYTFSVLAKYYRRYRGMKKKEIVRELTNYAKNYYPRYFVNHVFWDEKFEKFAKEASRKELFECDGIYITDKELDTIAAINDSTLERLAFTLLCIAKLNDLKNARNHGWVNVEVKEIFELARISCSVKERGIYLNKLYCMSLLNLPKKIGNINMQVMYIDDSGNNKLLVSDFRELGYEYLKYKGENFIRCQKCGRLTRNSKQNNKKYCAICGKYIPQDLRTITCIDCGRDFTVDINNKRSIRCPECQHIKQLEYQRISMKKARDVK